MRFLICPPFVARLTVSRDADADAERWRDNPTVVPASKSASRIRLEIRYVLRSEVPPVFSGPINSCIFWRGLWWGGGPFFGIQTIAVPKRKSRFSPSSRPPAERKSAQNL
jgi:hypothetical protein